MRGARSSAAQLEWLPTEASAGTRLRYVPGVVLGGGGLEHDCGSARGVGYFLEPLVLLALFGKKARRRGAVQPPGSRELTLPPPPRSR